MPLLKFILAIIFVSFHNIVFTASPELLHLDIYINDIKKDGVHPVVRFKNGVWLANDALKILNLHESISLSKKYFFEQSFALLPPWISTKIDMTNLSMSMSIPPEKMAIVDISTVPDPLLISPSTYAFYWNYDASINQQSLSRLPHFTVAHRPVLTSPCGSLSNQFITRSGDINNFVRLESAYLLDIPSREMRFVMGDFATDTPSFISSIAVGGLKFSKGHLFQSSSLSYPTLNFSGFSPRPGEAEIWINEMLNMKKEIPMGGFVLDNIRLPAGVSEGRLVLKDGFGIVNSIPFSFYGDPELLRPGFTSYSVSTGFVRREYAIKSFSYGQPAFFASHRLGLTNFWTSSIHSQVSPKTFLVGLEERFKLFNVGSTALAGATSVGKGGFGFLVAPQLQLDMWHINFKSRAIFASANYAPVSMVKERPKRFTVNLTSSLKLDRPYIQYTSLNYLLMQNGQNDKNALGIRQQLPIHRRVNLSFGADFDFHTRDVNGFIFLSCQTFEKHTVTAGVDKNYEHSHASIDAMGTLASQPDYTLSYGVGALKNDEIFKKSDVIGRGHINFENRYLRSQLYTLASPKDLMYMAQLASSFQIIKNRLFISRPIEHSLTLIEIPGQYNVRVYQNNSHFLGKTNSEGLLLIPNLLPYETTRLDIDFKDLNLFSAYDSNNSITLTPGFQTAHAVKLSSSMVRHLHFHLRQGKKPLPPGTLITIAGQEQPSFVMTDGGVYVDIPSEKTVLSGHDELNQCSFKVKLPPKTDAVIEEIKLVSCEKKK